MEWIKCETEMYSENDEEELWLWDGETIHHGSYGAVYDHDIGEMITSFYGFNYGYDGSDGPVIGITHYQPVVRPEPPKD